MNATDWATIDCEVRNLAGRYCDAVLRGDRDRFANCWTADAEWVVPGGEVLAGRDAIVDRFLELRRLSVLCVQELLSGVIEPGEASGADAVATWQIRETQRRSDGWVICTVGVYQDVMRRDDDGALRFARRQFDLVYRGPLNYAGRVWRLGET